MDTSHTISVTDFGAARDGMTLVTRAIQEAINAAASLGGGTVVVPPGLYLTGTLFLKSRVTFELQGGAMLLASPDLTHYAALPSGHNKDRHTFHLIVLDGVQEVTLRGGGTINGQGERFWHPRLGPNQWIKAKAERVRPLVECVDSQDVRLYDLQITDSPGWACHFNRCDRIFIRGLSITNDPFGPNTDGLDINGCRDVSVSDCYISTGDDAIILKTTRDSRSCERVKVSNCSLRTNCIALGIGTETCFDIRQITFSNCSVFQSVRALGIACADGATVEDIAVSNIVCDTDTTLSTARPIHLDLRKRHSTSSIGRIRNVQVSNFIARTGGRILMTAADGGILENILLRDLTLHYDYLEDPQATVPRSTSNQLSNHSSEARVARAAVVGENIRGLRAHNLQLSLPRESTGPRFRAFWGRNIDGGVLQLTSLNHFDEEVLHTENCKLKVSYE